MAETLVFSLQFLLPRPAADFHRRFVIHAGRTNKKTARVSFSGRFFILMGNANSVPTFKRED
ncbi:MAG: hypothetical protein ACE3JK_00390 [Sporolactobacillus sp.]